MYSSYKYLRVRCKDNGVRKVRHTVREGPELASDTVMNATLGKVRTEEERWQQMRHRDNGGGSLFCTWLEGQYPRISMTSKQHLLGL